MSALGVKFFVNMESLQDNHDIDKRVLELSLVIFNCGILSAIAFSKARFEISSGRGRLIGSNTLDDQNVSTAD